MDFTHMHANGPRLHVARAGPPDGPLLVFLHGFPEFWYGWRRQIDHFADRGYLVWAPDQRGYNRSDKPAGVAHYSLDHLAGDIVGLLDDAGRDRATIIGHDWGGIVAWRLAARRPERIDRLVVLNAPHPAVMRRRLLRSPAQLMRSWYVFLFQLPALPEKLLTGRNCRMLANSLRRTSRGGAFTDNDLQLYRRAWSQPGALTAMLNWYRAAMRRPPDLSQDGRIDLPVLQLWGARDRFLQSRIAEENARRCDRSQLEFFEEATHWLQHEEPERVNQCIEDFLQER